jgi:hypothetical protein
MILIMFHTTIEKLIQYKIRKEKRKGEETGR